MKTEEREMITPGLRKSMGKQGYKLVGTHSAVKLCRWTKSMLRGRGGCYKLTCFGIQSYQCMEASPSVACASRCVFCWRHNTHPALKQWGSNKVDDPAEIVEASLDQHRRMIKELRGVPAPGP